MALKKRWKRKTMRKAIKRKPSFRRTNNVIPKSGNRKVGKTNQIQKNQKQKTRKDISQLKWITIGGLWEGRWGLIGGIRYNSLGNLDIALQNAIENGKNLSVTLTENRNKQSDSSPDYWLKIERLDDMEFPEWNSDDDDDEDIEFPPKEDGNE